MGWKDLKLKAYTLYRNWEPTGTIFSIPCVSLVTSASEWTNCIATDCFCVTVMSTGCAFIDICKKIHCRLPYKHKHHAMYVTWHVCSHNIKVPFPFLKTSIANKYIHSFSSLHLFTTPVLRKADKIALDRVEDHKGKKKPATEMWLADF